MKKRLMKLGLVLAVPVMVLATTTTSFAYPPFVAKAEKFGAKDCTFCHTNAGGGKGWNMRGKWLMTEKKKRNASQIDVEWLSEYKGK